MVEPPQDVDPIWPCWIRELDLQLDEDERTGWNIYPIFQGSSRSLKELTSHASVLSAGTEPHPPHEHAEEELIVMLSGVADIVKVDDTPAASPTIQRIAPGSLVYHSAYQSHTIRSVGPGPTSYLMLKWRVAKAGVDGEPGLPSSIFHFAESSAGGSAGPSEAIVYETVFESRTRYLDKLHSHFTTLQPGAGYSPHRDPYDVAIVMLSGNVETLGRRVGPRGVIFYPAGEPHGMKNVGPTPASYLVFEFHRGAYKPESRGWRHWRKRIRRLGRRLRRLLKAGR